MVFLFYFMRTVVLLPSHLIWLESDWSPCSTSVCVPLGYPVLGSTWGPDGVLNSSQVIINMSLADTV